jgi:hypothetical protein
MILAREWAAPPTDSLALRLLASVSADLRDARLLTAVKSAALSTSQSRIVRLEAMRTLVTYFDPSTSVLFRVRPGIEAPGYVSVAFGGWSSPRGESGDEPLPATTKAEVLLALRQIRDTSVDPVVAKVAKDIIIGLEAL